MQPTHIYALACYGEASYGYKYFGAILLLITQDTINLTLVSDIGMVCVEQQP